MLVPFFIREFVKLLLSHGANVNLPGGVDNWTPLFFAALAGMIYYIYMYWYIDFCRPRGRCRSTD